MFNGIVIYGTHARKIKTTSFDAFESANIERPQRLLMGLLYIVVNSARKNIDI